MLRRKLRAAIRAAVRERGITVFAIANASGVDQSQLTRFLADERDLRLETAERVCRILGYELAPKGRHPTKKKKAKKKKATRKVAAKKRMVKKKKKKKR